MFFYYAASIVNALAESCEVLTLTRSDGYEFELAPAEGLAFKRSLLKPHVELVAVEHRQSDPRAATSLLRAAMALHRFAPDLIHVQDHADWRLYAAQRLAGRHAPEVLTVHDVIPHAQDARRTAYSA